MQLRGAELLPPQTLWRRSVSVSEREWRRRSAGVEQATDVDRRESRGTPFTLGRVELKNRNKKYNT